MRYYPDADYEPQDQANGVAERVEHRPYCLVLRRAYPHRDDEQGTDENRAQNNGRHSQMEGDAITRQRGVRGCLRERHADRRVSLVASRSDGLLLTLHSGSSTKHMVQRIWVPCK